MELTNQFAMLGLVFLASLLGGLIGLERQIVGKSAGMRTYALVSGAAAVLTFLGMSLVGKYSSMFAGDLLQSDPIRVIQAIIIGIGFVGSGVIAKDDKGEPKNLTTAASLLMAAAIGIAVAAGMYALAVGVTMLVIIVTEVFYYLEKTKLFRKIENIK